MSIDREVIYVAIFDLLKSKLLTTVGGPFVTVGRRHRMPPKELAPGQQPALFLCEAIENSNPKPVGTGGKLTLSALLFVYGYFPLTNEPAGQESVVPGTVINGLLKSIDDALAPPNFQPWMPQYLQTLGGLVDHVWTEGNTEIDPAIFGPQAVAVIPLSILCP